MNDDEVHLGLCRSAGLLWSGLAASCTSGANGAKSSHWHSHSAATRGPPRGGASGRVRMKPRNKRQCASDFVRSKKAVAVPPRRSSLLDHGRRIGDRGHVHECARFVNRIPKADNHHGCPCDLAAPTRCGFAVAQQRDFRISRLAPISLFTWTAAPENGAGRYAQCGESRRRRRRCSTTSSCKSSSTSRARSLYRLFGFYEDLWFKEL